MIIERDGLDDIEIDIEYDLTNQEVLNNILEQLKLDKNLPWIMLGIEAMDEEFDYTIDRVNLKLEHWYVDRNRMLKEKSFEDIIENAKYGKDYKYLNRAVYTRILNPKDIDVSYYIRIIPMLSIEEIDEAFLYYNSIQRNMYDIYLLWDTILNIKNLEMMKKINSITDDLDIFKENYLVWFLIIKAFECDETLSIFDWLFLNCIHINKTQVLVNIICNSSYDINIKKKVINDYGKYIIETNKEYCIGVIETENPDLINYTFNNTKLGTNLTDIDKGKLLNRISITPFTDWLPQISNHLYTKEDILLL